MKIDNIKLWILRKLGIVLLKRENNRMKKYVQAEYKKSELDNLVSQNQEVKDNFNLEKWCFDGGPDNENEEFSDNDITRLIKNQMEHDIRATSTVQKTLDLKEKIKNKFNEALTCKCKGESSRLHFYITN